MKNGGPVGRYGAALLAAVASLLWLAVPAAADKLDDVMARGRLLVGVSETSPPFSARRGEDGIVGYDVDLAARVAQRLGVAMERVPITNPQRIPALQQDRVDLLASGMTRAESRRRDIGFSV